MKTLLLSIAVFLLAGLALTGCEDAPSGPPAAAPAPLDRGLDPVQVSRGKAVYEKHCLQCHGAEGEGQPGDWRVRDEDGFYPPPPLDDSAHAWHHPTEVLLEAIRDGSPPGEGKMPAWKDKLTEQEMQDVLGYIKSLWSDEVYRLWQQMEQQSRET